MTSFYCFYSARSECLSFLSQLTVSTSTWISILNSLRVYYSHIQGLWIELELNESITTGQKKAIEIGTSMKYQVEVIQNMRSSWRPFPSIGTFFLFSFKDKKIVDCRYAMLGNDQPPPASEHSAVVINGEGLLQRKQQFQEPNQYPKLSRIRASMQIVEKYLMTSDHKTCGQVIVLNHNSQYCVSQFIFTPRTVSLKCCVQDFKV